MDPASSDGNRRKSDLDWTQIGDAVKAIAMVMMMRAIGDDDFIDMVAIGVLPTQKLASPSLRIDNKNWTRFREYGSLEVKNFRVWVRNSIWEKSCNQT